MAHFDPGSCREPGEGISPITWDIILPQAQASLDPVPTLPPHASHLASLPPPFRGRGEAGSSQDSAMSLHFGTKVFLGYSAMSGEHAVIFLSLSFLSCKIELVPKHTGVTEGSLFFF